MDHFVEPFVRCGTLLEDGSDRSDCGCGRWNAEVLTMTLLFEWLILKKKK